MYDALRLAYATVEHPGDRADLLEALLSFAEDYDNDFNGQNGEEYLWDDAKEAGFSSNAEYLLDDLDKAYPTDDRTLIAEYFSEWLGHDNYYHDYDFNIIVNKDDEIQHIILAFTTEV